jgi:diaminopimelate epimerase
MIFYKTSSFGNDFIAIDLETLPGAVMKRGPASAGRLRPSPCGAMPRRPLGASRDPQGELSLGGLAREICDRQRGVGADGVVFYRPQAQGARFAIHNRDGGAAELSGNGMAGLAAVLLQRRLARSPLNLQAAIGRRRVTLTRRQGPLFLLDVEIGVPDFAARGFFPFLREPQGRRPLGGPGQGQDSYRAAGVEFHPVSVGNPHAVVVYRQMPAAATLAALGKKLESHPLFPKRVNVEFVCFTSAQDCRVYFYERGVGPTQASSTGSAAVFAVLRRLGPACPQDRRPLGGLAGDHLTIIPASGSAEADTAPIEVSWRGGIHVRTRTRVVCRGEYFPGE